MSRRRGNKGEVAFQLFSFLDVLLCTIGALIIILTMTIHRARANAREEHARQAAPPAEVLKKQAEAVEEARWRQEQLEKSRTARQEELQNSRLALSHLEDHIRRLNERSKELMELLDKVESGNQAKTEDLAAAKKELAKIKDELAKKKEELEKKKKDVTNTEKWYALIPYNGPNGTRRMPIYIECVAEGVIIQPEGVLLTADDFRGEPSPGNPLDAALRTKREYIMKATGGKAAEPYPLLVVRPSGVLAYGAARGFMKFWEDEFGYELISEEKKLDFGPRDPNLDLVMNREIAQARQRQAALAAYMPRKYNREDAPRSFAPEENPELQRRRDAVTGGGVGSAGRGNGIGAGRGRGGVGGTGSGEGASGASGIGGTGGGLAGTNSTRSPGTGRGGPQIGTGSASGPYGSGVGSLGEQNPTGLAGTNPDGSGAGGSGGIGPGGAGPGGSNPGGTANGGTENGAGSKNPDGLRLTQPGQGSSSPGTNSVAGGAPSGTSETGSTYRPGSAGSNQSSQGSSTGGSSGTASGTSGGTAGGASGGASAGAGSPTGSPSGAPSMPNIGVNMGPADQQPPSTSKQTAKGRGGPGNSAKGKNWGLPEAQRHVTGVTRPIRVAVQKDKLILFPERDDRRPQEIGLSPEMTAKELDILVAGVQKQMRNWGIAVDGGYWKPALSVDVQPGAEDRFAELQSALNGSGIEVQRKIR
jgi:hypothetical protein